MWVRSAAVRPMGAHFKNETPKNETTTIGRGTIAQKRLSFRVSFTRSEGLRDTQFKIMLKIRIITIELFYLTKVAHYGEIYEQTTDLLCQKQ